MQVGNFFIASIIELLAEGMTLAEMNGLSSQHVVQFTEKLLPGHIVSGDIPLCSSTCSQ
jgi:3-hydroxyisobutyrate dehydrogenase-like beta-hydroxyacid dehydrogenase